MSINSNLREIHPYVVTMFLTLFCIILTILTLYPLYLVGAFTIIVLLIIVWIWPVVGLVIIFAIYPFVNIYINRIGYTYILFSYRILLTFIVFVWITRELISKKKEVVRKNNWIVFTILVGALLSTIINEEIFSETKYQAIKILKYGMYTCFCLAIYNLVSSYKQAKYMLFTFMVSASILAIMACIQYFEKIPLVYETAARQSSRLFIGEVSNPNIVNNVFVFAIPIALNYFLNSKGIIIRIFVLVGLIFMGGALILSQTRSAIFGITIAQILVEIVEKRISTKKMFLYVIIVSITIYSIPFLVEYLYKERFETQTMIDEDMGKRLRQYEAVMQIILKEPFGIDDETYDYSIMKHGGYRMSPHNMYLRTAIEIGIIGLIGTIILHISILYDLVKMKTGKKDKEKIFLKTAVIGGLIAYIIHNQAHNPSWEYPLWMIIGVGMAFIKINYVENRKKL
ncbi:MAG: O-antigen ligase family protein [bacterium]|nr:O-antigen ligase family protein [bacterium]